LAVSPVIIVRAECGLVFRGPDVCGGAIVGHGAAAFCGCVAE
jgi:hypothetical protein